MSETKQVKVDNWGIYFLQRLKHFFNRTDYCDLTLQFQDNAQLKVHRLVISACTEYFELLERTCEMYDDCLVMPDDLQADVVVPIINFMYTGQLEFKLSLLEKLYQTSLIMNMPVLTKLLDAHRTQIRQLPAKPAFQNSSNYYGKRYSKQSRTINTPSSSNSGTKRTYAYVDASEQPSSKKQAIYDSVSKDKDSSLKNGKTTPYQFPVFSERNKHLAKDPRPTRYELPEELDEDNIFDNSFTNISYTSKPLMVHPEATKQYGPKRSINLFEEGTSSNRFGRTASSNDIVECRKISMSDNIFVDDVGDGMQDDCNLQQSPSIKDDGKDTSQLFDQILDNTSKITIEAKNNTQANNIDHAKIISEVLKKYPQLVKSNKNIKLKILNTAKPKKSQPAPATASNEEKLKPKLEVPDFTYESDVINSKEAARLIALGAENVAGPWICLICGTPGKALHFTSYFNFRNHLVEVHNEKPVPTICEYCGVKSQKRNYLVYHKLTKHGVPAPSHYNFPRCNHCSYIALNEALMVKHKVSHSDKYKINFQTIIPSQQGTPSKVSQKYLSPAAATDKQKNQCAYCMRVFLREHNLYAHLKTNHKEAAKNDGIIDDSEEEQEEEKYVPKLKSNNEDNTNFVKVEVPVTFENSYEDGNDQYQIEQKPDGSIYVVSKKPRVMLPVNNKNKILNLGFGTQQQNVQSLTQSPKIDTAQNSPIKKHEFTQNLVQYIPPARPTSKEEIIIIDNNEYILQDNQLVPTKEKIAGQFITVPNSSSNTEVTIQTIMPTTSMEYHSILNQADPEHKVLVKKATRVNQPLQIVVSNEEEYKALMSSNQSVIYDERDSNKALAVLTAENTSLETGTIDLDNNQSNDMMIIPDDFNMNVPETVSTDNSNIVVVYSHPLEDQSKQYSLITTQSIEGEFVQSSTILTQNYETVTTCSPVMTAHTNIENSWQNNIHTNINKLTIAPSSDLQAMTVGESITIAQIESDTLNDLPEVHLTTTDSVPIQVTQNETNENSYNQPDILPEIHQQPSDIPIDHHNTIITITEPSQQNAITVTETNVLNNLEQQSVPHMEPLPVATLDQSNTISSFNQGTLTTVNTNVEQQINDTTYNTKELNPDINTVQVEEILQQDNPDTSHNSITAHPNLKENNTFPAPINENMVVQSCDTPHHLTDNNVVSEPMEHDTIVEEDNQQQEPVKEVTTTETIDNTIDIDHNQNNTSFNETSLLSQGSDDVTLTKVAKEQIENLTSEWSEDESDNQVVQQNIEKDKSNDDKISNEFQNIEKEVEQQEPSEVEHDTEDSIASSQDDISCHKTQTNAGQTIDPVSHEKISSLLNDWDDNDSQEDEASTIINNEINGETSNSLIQTEGVITTEANESSNNTEINKNDNIKSLVSDWDEEEDENKD